MNLGVIPNESMAEYQSSPAISGGKLRTFASNYPALFKARYIDRTVEEVDSTAFAFGRYAHSLFLEGVNATAAAFAVSPGFDRRTKDGKAAALEFAAAHEGKEIVTADDAILAARMLTELQANPVAVELLKQGAPEVTFRHAKIPAMPLQTRPDWYSAEPCAHTDGFSYVVNLKTVDGLKENFAHQAHKFGYFVAESFCRSVIADTLPADARPTRHFFIVCDKSAPYSCGVFEADEISMDAARRVVTRQLKELLACIESGNWPSGPAGITRIAAPDYWVKQHTEE